MGKTKTIRAIDLCCGAGGWACAARGLPIEFVAAADHAADCLETWNINHGAAHPACALVQADLSTAAGMRQVIDAAGPVGLILGAIPCEQLSYARANRPLKEGELEAVHDLIDMCMSAVQELRPRWWCFEGVIAVEGHLPGPLQLGIPYECRRIQAADYGPQKRLRTFFGAFPPLADPEPGHRVLADVLRPGPYRTLPKLDQYERSRSKWYGQGGKKKLRVQDADRASGTVISSHGGMGSNAERSGMVRVKDADQVCPTVATFNGRHERAALVELPPTSRERPQDPAEPSRAVIPYRNGDEMPVPLDPFSRERPQRPEEAARTVAGHDGLPVELEPSAQGRLYDPSKPSPAMTQNVRHDNGSVLDRGMVRVLEWQEAALLQGFPLDYIFAASWSRTWKFIAQAIPIYVGRAILQGIVKARK